MEQEPWELGRSGEPFVDHSRSSILSDIRCLRRISIWTVAWPDIYFKKMTVSSMWRREIEEDQRRGVVEVEVRDVVAGSGMLVLDLGQSAWILSIVEDGSIGIC